MLGLTLQAIVADLLLDLVQRGDRIECLIRVDRLDVASVVDFSARMCPALRVRDPRFLRIARVGTVAVALQYRSFRTRQAQRILDVLCRPTG